MGTIALPTSSALVTNRLARQVRTTSPNHRPDFLRLLSRRESFSARGDIGLYTGVPSARYPGN